MYDWKCPSCGNTHTFLTDSCKRIRCVRCNAVSDLLPNCDPAGFIRKVAHDLLLRLGEDGQEHARRLQTVTDEVLMASLLSLRRETRKEAQEHMEAAMGEAGRVAHWLLQIGELLCDEGLDASAYSRSNSTAILQDVTEAMQQLAGCGEFFRALENVVRRRGLNDREQDMVKDAMDVLARVRASVFSLGVYFRECGAAAA